MSLNRAAILLVLSFFGYLLCYIPFCALSNSAKLPSPLSILPISSLGCLMTMLVVTWLCKWWKYLHWKTSEGKAHPAVWSSFFSIPILLGVPMSYALPGVSMFLMGVLMKSGSLAPAPIADYWNGEPIKRSSWIALGLCVAAILTALGPAILTALGLRNDLGAKTWSLTLPAFLLFLVYVGGYLGRLRKMRGQKGSMEFFVSEHMLQPIVAFLVVCLGALFSQSIRDGFGLWYRLDLWGIGLFSQGIGLFGGWMLLYKRESSFSMPLNRAGAVIANLLANLKLHQMPEPSQLVGGGLVLTAIAALATGDKDK